MLKTLSPVHAFPRRAAGYGTGPKFAKWSGYPVMPVKLRGGTTSSVLASVWSAGG